MKIGQVMTIISRDGRVNLTYTPLAQMPTEVTTPLFSGALLHSYGVYSGYMSAPDGDGADVVVPIHDVIGILEDHYAYW